MHLRRSKLKTLTYNSLTNGKIQGLPGSADSLMVIQGKSSLSFVLWLTKKNVSFRFQRRDFAIASASSTEKLLLEMILSMYFLKVYSTQIETDGYCNDLVSITLKSFDENVK